MDKVFSHVQIKGIATAIPKEKLALSSLGSLYGEGMVAKIMKVTGIETVHLAPKGKTASDYCFFAAQKLMGELEVSPSEVDGIVFVTESPDYIVPHTSAVLQDRLGLPNTTIAFDINYGCAGYVYGLFQAFLLVETGCCKNVLLCVGDTLSRRVHPQDKALRMVLGDAGSATLISSVDKSNAAAFSFFTDGSGARHLIIPAGGQRLMCQKGCTDILHEDIDGNARTDENLYMDGMEIMEFALHEVRKVVSKAMAQVSWAKDETDLFALHQANALIVRYLVKQMKLDKFKVPISVKETGNTSSASIPLMLCNLYEGVNSALERVVVCGFGTGLSCAAGTIDLSGTHICSTFEI